MNSLIEELWTEARRLIETVHNLPDAHLKKELAERALQLSERAEAITNSMDDPEIVEMNIRRYQRRMLAGSPIKPTGKPSMRCSPTPKHCRLTFTGRHLPPMSLGGIDDHI